MLRCEFNQTFQVLDGSVNEDALGIVARSMCGEDGIGAGREDEDVVGYYIACRGFNGLVVGIDVGDSGVEVVVERSVRE